MIQKGVADPDDVALTRLCDELRERIALASNQVYEFDRQTPTQRVELPSGHLVWGKREDLSRVRSYKWRGAGFFLQQQMVRGNRGAFVTASAGNHAQGVALAARQLGVHADIFMPVTTPELKQLAVSNIGGEQVTVHLQGDRYDLAALAARTFANTHQATMVPAFDHVDVIAGQATVACELFLQHPKLERVYVPIGGGGLASGVGFVARELFGARCEVVGVEVDQQNAMQRSILERQRQRLKRIDTFCDGTAVAEPGIITFELCRRYVDRIICVTNGEVSSAMQAAWNADRFLPEPSGAIAFAGAMKEAAEGIPFSNQTAVVITGGNMDFRTIPRVVRYSMPRTTQRRHFRFTIAERSGALIELLDTFMSDVNIVDFQYGKNGREQAHPVLGLEGPADQLQAMIRQTTAYGCEPLDTSDHAMSQFRVIPFREDLCESVVFVRIDFPNRPGTLRELMRRVSDSINICYFDFVDTGEADGHALVAFECLQSQSRAQLFREIEDLGFRYAIAEVGMPTS